MATAPLPSDAGLRARQRGVTLVELMVAMVIGLVLVLAASAAFLAGKQLFNTDAEVQATQDSLRFARYIVQGVVRQAGYADYAPDRLADGIGVIASNANLLAGSVDPRDLNIAGATNTTVSRTDDSFGANDTDTRNQNDSLMVRFFGRSTADADTPDNTMIDCLGHPQKGPAAIPSAADRAWSFFYVALASDGEPELYCKYATEAGKFTAEPLARGVEKFKVVYGYDGNGDSVPEAWLDAKGIAAKAQATGGPINAEWRKVVAVRIGIVVRSARPAGDLKQASGHDYRLYPLGEEFRSSVYFDPPDDGRFRSTATFTLMLRNVALDPT